MIFVNAFSLTCSLGSNNSDCAGSLRLHRSPGILKGDGKLIGVPNPFFGFCCAPELPALPKELAAHESRNNQLLLLCLNEGGEALLSRIRSLSPDRIGVILGTSTSGSDEADQYIGRTLRGEASNFSGYAQELGDPARFLAKYLGLKGPAFTISTACTSGARSFISAARMIEAGIIDAALVGGADTLARMPVNGFNALEALSKDLCLPFDQSRKGITIGEGAALFFLSKNKSDIALLGYGESGDAHHVTAPDPQGKGAARAMLAALEKAHLRPEYIAYVNAHGTGTALNDSAEIKAMESVFPASVPFSSTKQLTGHTLGAAGAVEAAICCLLLSDPSLELPPQRIPTPEPEALKLGLITEGIPQKAGAVMTNNFAFGGNNTSLIFGVS